MSDPVKLHKVETLSPPERVRNEIVDLLRRTLTEAETEPYDGIIVAVTKPNGLWKFQTSNFLSVTKTLGCLECIKAEIIKDYISD
jgi:hypothetical protein